MWPTSVKLGAGLRYGKCKCVSFPGPGKYSVSSFLESDISYNKEVCVRREQIFLVDRGNNYKPNQ